MATLLVVHHTSSPALQAMFEAVMAGASADDIEGVEVAARPALTASAADVLAADGYLLGTPGKVVFGILPGRRADHAYAGYLHPPQPQVGPEPALDGRPGI